MKMKAGIRVALVLAFLVVVIFFLSKGCDPGPTHWK